MTAYKAVFNFEQIFTKSQHLTYTTDQLYK